MITNCILLNKSDIQKIIAEHFGVELNDVIMHTATVTVTNVKAQDADK